jgi:hypothetical protein
MLLHYVMHHSLPPSTAAQEPAADMLAVQLFFYQPLIHPKYIQGLKTLRDKHYTTTLLHHQGSEIQRAHEGCKTTSKAVRGHQAAAAADQSVCTKSSYTTNASVGYYAVAACQI